MTTTTRSVPEPRPQPSPRAGRPALPGGRGRARRRAALVLLPVLASAVLAGCSGGASSSAGASDAAAAPEAAVPAAGVPAVAEGGVAAPGYVAKDQSTTSGTGTVSQGSASTPLALGADRSVVVRADTSVRVTDVSRATVDLGTIAVREGATIDSQVTSRGDGTPVPVPAEDAAATCGKGTCPTPSPSGYASSTTTLRVDNTKVDALLRDVATLGTVEASWRSAADVTAEVADVASRVRNAEASLARVRALLDKATKLGEVVTLEAELTRRQSDLEALEARQRALADQTAQATVTVRLVASDAPVTVAADTGFLAGLRAGWDAFTSATVVVLTAVGAVLPFLLVLLPVALVVWFVVRRQRPAVPSAAPAGPVDA